MIRLTEFFLLTCVQCDGVEVADARFLPLRDVLQAIATITEAAQGDAFERKLKTPASETPADKDAPAEEIPEGNMVDNAWNSEGFTPWLLHDIETASKGAETWLQRALKKR